MSSRIVLAPKYVSALQSVVFDFTSEVGAYAPGETIASQVTTCTVYSGTDASPSSVISGSGAIATPIVTQDITGGVAGVLYQLKCTAVTSGSHTLVIDAWLCVIPDLT